MTAQTHRLSALVEAWERDKLRNEVGQLSNARLIDRADGTIYALKRLCERALAAPTGNLITCKGCSAQFRQTHKAHIFHDAACAQRYWRKHDAVYDPTTRQYRARRAEDRTLTNVR